MRRRDVIIIDIVKLRKLQAKTAGVEYGLRHQSGTGSISRMAKLQTINL
jgi:hypothetical protein